MGSEVVVRPDGRFSWFPCRMRVILPDKFHAVHFKSARPFPKTGSSVSAHTVCGDTNVDNVCSRRRRPALNRRKAPLTTHFLPEL